MSEPIITFSPSQRADIRRRYKQTRDRRISERIHALLLLESGRTLADVATILVVNPKTIRRWVACFTTHGLDALCTLGYKGQDELLTPDQWQQLMTWLDQGWPSCAEICAYVRDTFGYDYTDSGMIKLLKRHGYRYRKPAQIPAKADPTAQAAWVQEYAQKKRP